MFDTVGRWTDAGAWVYTKLTYELSANASLKGFSWGVCLIHVYSSDWPSTLKDEHVWHCEQVDDRHTDALAWLYYKLIYEASAQASLKGFLVMWFSFMYFLLIGQALWMVKMFDTVNRRKSDGRTPEHGYTISYSAQADLKRLFNTSIFFSFKDLV